MRGARVGIILGIIRCNLVYRIIPADAGSTQTHNIHIPTLPDHPRGCGEHRPLFIVIWLRMGSSPRVRGARVRRVLQMQMDRIIPADAGSTYM